MFGYIEKRSRHNMTRAFLSCFEITYQFYQLVIYLINVHLAEKKNTGRTNSCTLKIT